MVFWLNCTLLCYNRNRVVWDCLVERLCPPPPPLLFPSPDENAFYLAAAHMYLPFFFMASLSPQPSDNEGQKEILETKVNERSSAAPPFLESHTSKAIDYCL